jgi:hypothetical protein
MLGASIFTALFLGSIVFVIYLIVIRIIFRIERNTRNQEATIFLLIKLWEKEGADPQQVQLFQKKYKVKYK